MTRTARTTRPATQHKSAEPLRDRTRLITRTTVAALLLLAISAYFPALRGQTIWDDSAHMITRDRSSVDWLIRFWTDYRATQQYYPLTFSVFWLQYHLWGDHTLGYHILNLLIHATNALLVWRILKRLHIPGDWFAAALFLLHPVLVESVAWISELKNTLSGFFYLSATLLYLRFDGSPLEGTEKDESGSSPPSSLRQAQGRPFILYPSALVLFTLGLFVKSVIATFPAAMLVIIWWRRGRIQFKRDVRPLIPFFLVGAGMGIATAWIEHTVIGANGPRFNLNVADRILIAGRAVWFYFGKLLWPRNLVFIYPRWRIDHTVAWQYLFPLGAMAAIAILWSLRTKLGRGPLAAALFFGGSLFPALGFLNVYPFVFSFVADHFQYLASLGVLTLAAATIAWLMSRAGIWNRPAGVSICAVILIALTILSHRRAGAFVSAEKILEDTLAKNPNSAMALNNYGVYLIQQKRYGEAKHHFELAIQADEWTADAWINLATMLMGEDRFDEAIADLNKAATIAPSRADTYRQMGLIYHKLGREDVAQERLTKSLGLMPDDPITRGIYGASLIQTGQIQLAIDQLRESVRLDRGNAEAQSTLGVAYARVGVTDWAITAYLAALKADPDHIASLNNLAWIYATDPLAKNRNGAEAIRLAKHAMELSKPKEADLGAADTLAAAYAEVGQFDQAVATLQIALDRSSGASEAFVAAVKERMKLYQTGRPYREDPTHPLATS